MNLIEYKNVALQRLNKTITNNPKESKCYSCMGLIEETGEIIAELRKPLFKGNFHEKTLDIQNIKSELGDLMWYIALICKEYNVNVEEIENFELTEPHLPLPKREQIIQIAINMGQSAGAIIKECKQIYIGNESKEELINKIREQYKNINELARLLDITMEQILNENIKKINSRYDEKGEANRENEKDI